MSLQSIYFELQYFRQKKGATPRAPIQRNMKKLLLFAEFYVLVLFTNLAENSFLFSI